MTGIEVNAVNELKELIKKRNKIMKTFKAQITIMFIGLLLSVTSFFMIGSYVKVFIVKKRSNC